MAIINKGRGKLNCNNKQYSGLYTYRLRDKKELKRRKYNSLVRDIRPKEGEEGGLL